MDAQIVSVTEPPSHSSKRVVKENKKTSNNMKLLKVFLEKNKKCLK